ncbi:nuclear transport factor 2 family protein [Aureibacter tunicatorum]|uniref:Ketosteroid isomerase-like protein n=1 Tax=Aureibacter tunicatorum TaxID=866807 RepID=A0AAE3XMQ5_9BACT|nr:nuclear transport factor 2 family protein [Aureibacter tunicatorum]MDR6240756.1 ketosteroid isomerase-like protein [Aureibacter tunicatorum]BDD06911.1 hypothetical protein AUTU_43940 [Aureibacter tunicatorum]
MNKEIAKRNKENVMAFFKALEKKDAQSVVNLFAEDGVQSNPYASGIFPQGAKGYEEILAYWKAPFHNFGDMEFLIDEIYAMEDPNIVFVKYTGNIMYKDGSGKYANQYYSTFKFAENGKIKEYVEIFNPIVAAKAFGLIDMIK